MEISWMREPLLSLIRAYALGSITPEQLSQLEHSLKSDTEARELFLHEMSIHAALDDASAGFDTLSQEISRESGFGAPGASEPRVSDMSTAVNAGHSSGLRQRERSFRELVRALTAVIAVSMIALTVSLYVTRQTPSPRIARITGVAGPLLWTGDGGRTMKDLTVGTELSGGTIEGMVPETWFELEFNDGSTVTISGNSMLTFSDYGQKELHLRKGAFSANVVPQPAGRPMLVHTRSALLEVLGTQFEVQAGLSSTLLNVSEGKVRVKRLSDGSVVEVPSRHRVIASADRDLKPAKLPDARYQWKSGVHRGPEKSYGKWIPATAQWSAALKAIPYTSRQGVTVNAAGFGVSTGDTAPVVLHPDSIIKVHGRITDAHEIYFGVTVRHPNGEYAGRFHTIRSADEFEPGQDFSVSLPISDFRLDLTSVPTRRANLRRSTWIDQDRFPETPTHLIVESVWLHSLFAPAGLQVTKMELIPAESAAPAPSQ